MKVLGIDPGYDRIGWAVLDFQRGNPVQVVDLGCIQTKKTSTILERYSQIIEQLKTVCKNHHPEEVSLEKVFFSKNQKTAMQVSESRGVILATLMPFHLETSEYTPNQIKLAVTGYGSADKRAVEKMIRMQIKLPATKIIDDTIDAVAIAFTHTLLRTSSL